MRTRATCKAIFALLIFNLAVAIQPTSAAAFPDRPIRMIVAYSAGSTVDARARQLANHLTDLLGQQIIVDNRSGASGVIAMTLAANAAADGYTLLFANSTQLAALPAVKRKLPYDVFKQYSPVGSGAQTPSLIVISPSIPAQSLGEFIAMAKSKPRQFNFGSQGNGSTSHLSGALLMQLTGINAVHVPYKTYGLILSDLFSGQVSFLIGGPTAMLPHVKAGRLRALAINGSRRISALPDVPTFDEAGVANFWIAPWYGLLVPARTPAGIIKTFNADLNKSLKMADVVKTAESEGQTILGGTPEQFSAFIKLEFQRYQKLARDVGVTLD